MKKFKVIRQKISADMFTPVGLYLSLRDRYPNALLLESSDYHSSSNSSSFLCLNPIASIRLKNSEIETEICGSKASYPLQKGFGTLPKALQQFIEQLQLSSLQFGDGLFGYINYDAVAHFEDIDSGQKNEGMPVYPAMVMSLYRFVLHLNHFNDTLEISEYIPEDEPSALEHLMAGLRNSKKIVYPFLMEGSTTSNLTDEEYLAMVDKGRYHCRRGDVFQIVLSRQYSQKFRGDDFNVYRALRRINPSPYLYYFDYDHYRIFGSSPEAQLKISKGEAILNPIAGTYRRSGNDEQDKELAVKLFADPKENAEHAMLVDLARNDLSRNCSKVHVASFRELQYFSHVIHMVSKVSGTLRPAVKATDVIADTFPAGTLSGAPKHKAMQLIEKYEPQARGFYGGAAGFIGFDGSVNLAILIRSFLSIGQTLHFQAGAGIVEASNPHSELQEVNNKLAALHKAIQEATEFEDLKPIKP